MFLILFFYLMWYFKFYSYGPTCAFMSTVNCLLYMYISIIGFRYYICMYILWYLFSILFVILVDFGSFFCMWSWFLSLIYSGYNISLIFFATSLVSEFLSKKSEFYEDLCIAGIMNLCFFHVFITAAWLTPGLMRGGCSLSKGPSLRGNFTKPNF